MAIVGTGLSLASVKSEFFKRFEATETFFADLSTRIASNSDKESYKFLGTVPPMREWGTGRLARGLSSEKYDVENLKYEITMEVDRDEIDDDQTGQIRLRIGEMAARAATHKDAQIGLLLENGVGAGFLAYDGVPFFSTTHNSFNSGDQDNTLAPSAVVPTAPTTTEFLDAVKASMTRMMTFVDDQGEPMSHSATGLVLVVPPSMYITALEAINTTLIQSTTNVLQGAARILTMPQLTNLDTFYLLKTNVPVRPFIFQDRAPIELNSLEFNSETGFRREVYEFGVRARYRMTYGYWQYATKNTFA